MSKFDELKAADAQSSSVISTSSIEIWLDDQPLPADYERVADVGAPHSDKKRKNPAYKYSRRRQNKHQKLSEIPVNTMSTSEPRITRGGAAKSQNSPRKKPSKSGERVPSTPKGRRHDITDDSEDPTPKAQAHPFVSKPSIPTPSHDDRQSSHASSAASSEIHPGSSVSRSRSPTKRDYDLELSDTRVVWKLFSSPDLSLSDEANDLLEDLRSIADGNEVIPGAVQNSVVQYMKEQAKKELTTSQILRCFSSSVSTQDLSPKPGDLSHEEFFNMAVRVTRAAARCKVDAVPEPEWNSAVHYAIFNLALESLWLSKGIWFHDVSTSRITDKSLLPTISSQSKIMQSQMVDYAMVIRPSEHVEERIISKLIANHTYSINQTDAKHVRFTPIALSVETKRAAIEEDKAKTQLETWVSAHFAKLRQLIDEDSSIPFLPLIMIQGNQWNFMIAEMVDSKRSANAKKIVIYEDQELGNTKSILGVYQLLAAVQRLAKWTDEKYRPWFESQVLNLE